MAVGNILNSSDLGRSFGVSHTTIRKYLDLLAGAFVVDELRPWYENTGKRAVKAPKVYVADSGILHALLGLPTMEALHRHPKLGASWEGFILGQVLRALRARRDERFFWATHGGAELDLLVVSGGKRLGFEVKHTDTPRLTRSLGSALETLRLDSLTVVHAGARTFPMGSGVEALAAADLLARIEPLRADQ